MEYALVGYADAGMPGDEELLLSLCETTTNLYDVVVGTLVDLGIRAPDKVEDVHGQRAISGADLVDDEVLVREALQERYSDTKHWAMACP
jgi:hypothetical protein